MPLHLGVVTKDVIKPLPECAFSFLVGSLERLDLVGVQDTRHKPAELLGVLTHCRDFIAQVFTLPELNPVGGILRKLPVVRTQSGRGIFLGNADLVEQVGDRVFFQGLVGCRGSGGRRRPRTLLQKLFALVFWRVEKL